MSDLIIKIGDDALNLSQGETIAITKQAAKVGDFSRVLADGTNEVTIPPTSNNIAILENAHLIQSESVLPYRRLPATVIQEGYETLQDAFATVKSSKDNFSLQVIGGNASFFNLIKDLNLRDLDLVEYDHFWTNQNVFDNRNNTDGFIYALFEQSDNVADPTLSTYGTNLYAVQTEYLLPCFFDHTLIEKIFSEQDWDFDCDLIGTNIYDASVDFAASTPNRGTDSSYLNVLVTQASDTTLVYNGIAGASIPSPLIENGAITTQETIYWDETTLNTNLLTGRVSMTGDLFESTGNVILLPDATRVTATFTLSIENFGATGDINIYAGLAYSSDAGDLFINEPAYVAPAGISEYVVTFEFDATKTLLATDYFNAGETGAFLTIYYDRTTAVTDPEVKAGSTANYSFEFISAYDITTTVPYNFLRGFTPVSDMKQGDYLKEVAKKFQFIYDVNEVTHTVTAKRFDQIKENIPNAVDLSDKLHNEPKAIDIQYRIAGYAQTNYLKWKPDDITKYTAQGVINVDDQTLEAEKTVVEMAQYAASSPVTRFDTKQVPYIPLFTEGLPTNGMTDRMLLIRRETFAYNINFNRGTDLPTDDVTFAYFAEAGNTDSLDFPTLIERFYQTLNDMLYKAISITCLMNLKIKDVVNYNPFIPVYISKFSNYFYWEKLSNYVRGKLTSIKITRL